MLQKRLSSVLLASVLVMGMVACADQPAQEGARDTADQAAQPKQANAEFRQYCEKILAIETFPEPEIDFEALNPEQQREESKRFAAQLAPLAEEARAAAPEEIRGEINTLADAVKKVQETGDFESAFDNPETDRASDRAHEFDLENCGWGRVDVTAVNYEFRGIPETLNAGATSFELKNEGSEPHEIALFRINDDVSESAEELLELPEEEAMKRYTFAAATFADPGEEEYALAQLKEGRYMAVCFIPVGTEPEEGGEEGSPSPGAATPAAATPLSPTTSPSPGGEGQEGPPHFTRGMLAEFEVR